ncbi:MAG: aspartyl/glutamyl-tRNA amidotransferase subunit C [Anaerolineales bacterium]
MAPPERPPAEETVTQKPHSDPPITPEIFDHLVSLAAMELEGEEAEYLMRELNQQLQAIRDLESIELPEELPITSHGVPYSLEIRPELREDRKQPSTKADSILDQAPEVEDRFIVVPDIPRTELE